MRAAILEADRSLVIREVARDEISSPDQALVEVRSCTVCATDLKWYTGARPINKPTRFGHEIAGVVTETGEDVRHVKPGDRVLSRIVFGGFADYVISQGARLAKLPDNVGFEEGAIGQLLPIGVSGAEKSFRAGDVVLVCGVGPAGLLMVQLARAYGARRVIAADLCDWKLGLAGELGASDVVNVSGLADVATRIREMTDGVGVDVAVECVGAPDSYRTCERSTRENGAVTIFGSILEPVTVDFMYWELMSLNVNAMREATEEQYATSLNRAVELLERGDVRLKPILTHVRKLDEVQDAFEYCLAHRDEVLKMAIVP